MSVLLRSVSVLALAAAALAAHGQVSYTFTYPSFSTAVTVLASAPVTSTTAFTSGISGTVNGSPVTRVDFTVPAAGTTFTIGASSLAGGISTSGIPIFYLTNSGTFNFNNNAFTSIVPVPEPSALAALGLGVVAFVRRRKRA